MTLPALRVLCLTASLVLAGCATPPPTPAPPESANRRLPVPQAQRDIEPAQPSANVPSATRDPQGRAITAHFAPPAGWGERVDFADAAGTYRVLLEALPRGGWRVQDFYEISGKPFSDPFVLQRESDLKRQPATSVDGWLRQYHHEGGRKLVQLFRNGKAEGTASSYYVGNKRKSVTIYRDDQPEGVGTFWHPNGTLALKVTYRKGRPAEFRGWSEGGEPLPSDLAQALYEHVRKVE